MSRGACYTHICAHVSYATSTLTNIADTYPIPIASATY